MSHLSHGNDAVTIDALREAGDPVIVYGAGSIARQTTYLLAQHGLNVACLVVDDAYVTRAMGGHSSGTPIVRRSQVDDLYPRYSVVAAHSEALLRLEGLRNRFPRAGFVGYLSEVFGYDVIDLRYWQDNQHAFTSVRDRLADELSVRSFDAYLRAKVQSDARWLWPCVVEPQYFPEVRVTTGSTEPPMYSRTDNEVLLSCGGFDGDTLVTFDRLWNRRWRHASIIDLIQIT